MSEPLSYGVPQLASLLGLSKQRVYELIHAGELPAIQVGKRILVRREDAEAWLDAQPDYESA
jgi:excisionase family DNA binding protein